MSSVARKLLQVQPSAADDTGDDDFANVVLLLDGDGTSGDDNNTFTNSGSTVTTIGTTGDVIQGSFNPYGEKWSVYYNGSNTSTSYPGGSNYDPNTTGFTVSFFAKGKATGTNVFVAKGTLNSASNSSWWLETVSGVMKFYVSNGSSYVIVSDTVAFSSYDGWVHVAAVIDNSTAKLYMNGTLKASSSITSVNATGTVPVSIGAYYTNQSYGFEGYISNVRIHQSALYSGSSFDVPTTVNRENATLWAHYGNNISSSFQNHGTPTYTGSPKHVPNSPVSQNAITEAYTITDGGSAYFAGSGDHVDITDNNDLDFGTGDFTFEFWAYVLEGTSGNDGLISKGNSGTGWQIIYTAGEKLKFIRTSGNSSSPQITSSSAAAAYNQWHHIALTRSGATVTLWINGVSEGSYIDSTSWDTSEPLRIATNRGENNDYVGYISDFRLFKGFVKYTAAFDPPTTPLGGLTNPGGTLDYVEYENKSFSVSSQETNPQGVRFKPDGTKMYVVGNAGNDVMQYSLSTAWDVSTASFDSVTLSVGSQDGTPNGIAFSSDGAEMYISGNDNNKVFQYDLSTPWDLSTASYANKSLTTQGTNPIEPFMRSNGTDFYCLDNNSDAVFQYSLSTANDISTATYASKTISVSSQETTPTGLAFSSDGTKMFVCGQVGDDVNQYTLSTAWDISTASFDSKVFSFTGETTNPAGIDLKPDDTKLYMISNAGDAVYQYDLAATKQPEVLLNFQDAGIYDRTGINNIDTLGTAQIDTSVVKYGTGSIEFDGNSDYLLGSENPADTLVIHNAFTAECWFYQTATAGTGNLQHTLISHWNNSTGNKAFTMGISGTSMILYVSNDGSTNNISGATGGTVSNNVWNHVALTWDGTNYRVFLNGTAVITQANSSPPYASNEVIQIGMSKSGGSGSANMFYQGYMDDIRITNGIARYTSNFTPPTAALPKF